MIEVVEFEGILVDFIGTKPLESKVEIATFGGLVKVDVVKGAWVDVFEEVELSTLEAGEDDTLGGVNVVKLEIIMVVLEVGISETVEVYFEGTKVDV